MSPQRLPLTALSLAPPPLRARAQRLSLSSLALVRRRRRVAHTILQKFPRSLVRPAGAAVAAAAERKRERERAQFAIRRRAGARAVALAAFRSLRCGRGGGGGGGRSSSPNCAANHCARLARPSSRRGLLRALSASARRQRHAAREQRRASAASLSVCPNSTRIGPAGAPPQPVRTRQQH